MSSDTNDPPPLHAPLDQLEQRIIDDFLRTRGYDAAKLAAMAPPAREALLKEASTYAAAKLAEVESRSRLVDELHNG
jgi:hypothetical protein